MLDAYIELPWLLVITKLLYSQVSQFCGHVMFDCGHMTKIRVDGKFEERGHYQLRLGGMSGQGVEELRHRGGASLESTISTGGCQVMRGRKAPSLNNEICMTKYHVGEFTTPRKSAVFCRVY